LSVKWITIRFWQVPIFKLIVYFNFYICTVPVMVSY
jgi:hypothetical protein